MCFVYVLCLTNIIFYQPVYYSVHLKSADESYRFGSEAFKVIDYIVIPTISAREWKLNNITFKGDSFRSAVCPEN